MKHGKNPNVRQKKLLTQWKLNYKEWLIVKDTSMVMQIVHRNTGETKTIPKEF